MCTCIFVLEVLVGWEGGTRDPSSLLFPLFQVEYDAHYTQLNFLRTLSNYANQNITYACRNSKAWEDGQHSIKLMGSNEMEYHATSKISLRPKVVTNECTVGKSSFSSSSANFKVVRNSFLFICLFILSQDSEPIAHTFSPLRVNSFCWGQCLLVLLRISD